MVGNGVVLQTGLSMDAYSGFFNAFGGVFIGAMVLVILFSAVPGWFMARKALAGVADGYPDGSGDFRVQVV